MAVVITVAQQKGGAGKTTLAANSPRRSPRPSGRPARHRSAAQPQHWHELGRAGSPPVATVLWISGWRLDGEVDRLRRDDVVLIVEARRRWKPMPRLAVRGADLVLVPVQPSPPDLWAAEGTLRLAARKSGKVPACCSTAPRKWPSVYRRRGRLAAAAAGPSSPPPCSATAPASRAPSRKASASPKRRRNPPAAQELRALLWPNRGRAATYAPPGRAAPAGGDHLGRRTVLCARRAAAQPPCSSRAFCSGPAPR